MIGTAVLIFLIFGIFLTVVLELFAGNIADLLQVPSESRGKAIEYLRICSGGIIVIIAYNVISAIMRGIGNANLPLLFVGIACVFNVFGDLLLTGLLGMDVAGVAIATVGAQLISVVISILVLLRQELPFTFSKKYLRIDRTELKMILRIGIPIAIQETMVQISFLVINSIVNQMGLLPSAGYGVAQKIVSFIMLVPSSVMQSVSAFVAQNVGAGQKDRAKKGLVTAIISGCTLGIFIFCAGFFGGSFLSSFFTESAEVIAQSADYLKGFSPECILTCILFSCIGYFNGNGNSLPVMIQGVTSALLIRIPLCIFAA